MNAVFLCRDFIFKEKADTVQRGRKNYWKHKNTFPYEEIQTGNEKTEERLVK